MKLSEAMRKGAELRYQAHHDYFRQGGSCALGAVYEATRGEFKYSFGRSIANELGEDYPALNNPYIDHVLGEVTIRQAIAFRNDDLYWTREQIADWLEAQGY